LPVTAEKLAGLKASQDITRLKVAPSAPFWNPLRRFKPDQYFIIADELQNLCDPAGLKLRGDNNPPALWLATA